LFHNIEELLGSGLGLATILRLGTILSGGGGLLLLLLLSLAVIGELKISGEVLRGGQGKPDQLKGDTVGGLGLRLKVSVFPFLGCGGA